MEPRIADKKPAVIDVEPGTHHFCACGASQKQPFCDGSHKGTEFKPIAFEVTEKTRMALCLCKHTKKGHLCDGTHKSL